MFDKIVTVCKCPDDVKEALQDIGYRDADEVTIDTAMGIWSQFHIGDSQWGQDACDHIERMSHQHATA